MHFLIDFFPRHIDFDIMHINKHRRQCTLCVNEFTRDILCLVFVDVFGIHELLNALFIYLGLYT